MATLTVGSNRQYATIAAALAAARAGDTVAVSAGTYVDDVATIRTRVMLTAVGGQVTLLATRRLPAGGALLTVSADAVIEGFVFAGATAADGSAAGLLYTAGALTVRNSLFSGNDTGLLALPDANGTILVQRSEFARNGAGDGFSHNVAVAAIKSLTIQDSYIHDAAGGAEVRSRAKATTIQGTRIADNAAASTVSLDLPNGGVVLVQDSVIEKGAAAGPVAIRAGGDTVQAGSSLRVVNTTLVSDRSGALLLQNQAATPATLTNDTVWGFDTARLATGPVTVTAPVLPAARPALSTAPVIEPALPLPTDPGRAGAVVANGTVRTVGAGGAYRTLAAAVAAAQDGDTIRLAPGTYTDDAVTVAKRLIIEGYGGTARLVATRPPANGLALVVATTDLTLRNVEIAGAAIPGGVGAAILAQAGRLTLVNAYLHGNQAGLLATGGASASVGVYDTEIAANGTPDGGGGNIDVGAVGSLVLRNAWVHDGQAAAEIRSRAGNTVLDATRVSQVRGNGAALLELPAGGRVTVGGSVLEKGRLAQATPLIHVAGAASGSSVTLASTTLIGAASTAAAIVAEPGAATLSTAGATLRTGLTVSTAAPWGATAAPDPASLTTTLPAAAAERGVLTLRVSGDAFQGDARFTVAVDGAQVAGTLAATARHAAGQTQSFTIAGQYAAGPHSVTVRFVNDLDGDRGGRALYLDGAAFNGVEFGSPATLAQNGAVTLSTAPVTRPTNVVVNLREDMPDGDAQAFIAIDGTVLGGLQRVSGAESMRFLVDLAPGAHTVSVAALDPGRRVYVDSLDVAGQAYAGATTPVKGASSFAFTVAPPPAANAELFLTAGLPQALFPAG